MSDQVNIDLLLANPKDRNEYIEAIGRFIAGLNHAYPGELPVSILGYRDIRNDDEKAKETFMADTAVLISLMTENFDSVTYINFDVTMTEAIKLISYFDFEDQEVKERIQAIVNAAALGLSRKYSSQGYRKPEAE